MTKQIYLETLKGVLVHSILHYFYQTFFSPQVKRCAIITYKHDIYELSEELPNDFRLRTL